MFNTCHSGPVLPPQGDVQVAGVRGGGEGANQGTDLKVFLKGLDLKKNA